MPDIQKVFKYNRELHDSLALIFGELNQGQRKKILKNPEIKALLLRYHVIEENESKGG